MGKWLVDNTSTPGVLRLELEGIFSFDEMAAFVEAHDRAIDDFRGGDYRVFCDIRNLRPLSPEAAGRFEKGKAYSAAHPNFQGSAVLVSSKLVGLQHQRTSIGGGVMETELITDDEAACWEHLKNVRRSPPPPSTRPRDGA